MGAHNGLVCSHQRLGRRAPAQPSKVFHNAEGPRSSLDKIASMRAEGEVGIQRDAQDFKGSVLRGHLVADGYATEMNRITADFWEV